MNDIEMKKQILKMLREVMLQEDGKKFAPKDVHMEMVVAKPASEEGLQDVLEKAQDEAPPMDEFEESPEDRMMDKAMAAKSGMSEDEFEGSPEDEEMDKKMSGKKSFRDFFDM